MMYLYKFTAAWGFDFIVMVLPLKHFEVRKWINTTTLTLTLKYNLITLKANEKPDTIAFTKHWLPTVVFLARHYYNVVCWLEFVATPLAKSKGSSGREISFISWDKPPNR